MKKFAIAAATAAFAFGGSAWAADMPVKAPVYKAPLQVAHTWTGFYVGAGVGYGAWTSVSQAYNVAGPQILTDFSSGGTGWLGTVVIGGDYQFAPRWVAGVFADYDWANIKGEYQLDAAFWVGTRRMTSAWAVGGRLGYLLTPSAMLYVTGGYTQARFSGVEFRDTFMVTPGILGYVNPNTFRGWFLGIGTEANVWSNWYARLEYRYAKYGGQRENTFFAGGVPSTVLWSFEPTVQTVKASLIYKLNSWNSTAEAGPDVWSAPSSANWTGIYVAAGAGYGAWTAVSRDYSFAGVLFKADYSSGGQGWLGTVVIGGDYQFAPRWVAGVFADVDWTNIKGEYDNEVSISSGIRRLTSAWAAGGRLGFLLTPSNMLYATGGYTQAKFSDVNLKFLVVGGGPVTYINANTFNGWFVGIGTETNVWSNWYARLEYRYAKLAGKRETEFSIAGAGPVVLRDFEPTVQTVRAALVYKFYWPM